MVKHIIVLETDDDWTDDYDELFSDSVLGLLECLSENGVNIVCADRFIYSGAESDHFNYQVATE